MTQIIDILEQSRSLISDPHHWTTRSFARMINGHPTWPSDPDAVCWCSLGAIKKISVDNNAHINNVMNDALHLLYEAASILFNEVPPVINDNLGHSYVLQIYDKAINLAKSSNPS